MQKKQTKKNKKNRTNGRADIRTELNLQDHPAE